jgi:hypothetical protein
VLLFIKDKAFIYIFINNNILIKNKNLAYYKIIFII